MVGKDGTILYHWREIRQLQASSLRCITKLRFDPSNYHLVGIWAKQMWSLEADGGVLLIGGIKVEAPQSLLGILWQFRSGYIKADSVLVEINRSKKEDWSLRKKKKNWILQKNLHFAITLQHWLSFYCTEKWLSCTYTNIFSYFVDLFLM